MCRFLWVVVLVSTVGCAATAAAQPSVPQFEEALTARLQKLRPDGMTERNVLFQEVKAGTPGGGTFPFQATLVIRDYGPGYPANHFFGDTCVSRMEKWTFEMRKDDFGAWTVDGRMTPDSRDCKRNPSAGASAVPLSTLSGTPAAVQPATARSRAPASAASAPALPMGEYACYGTGSRLMAGMGFKLMAAGHYTDVEGKRGGSYTVDPAKHTIRFSGGFLGDQTGTIRGRGFSLLATVSCEPWK